jgi:RecB family exonuclease
MDQGDHFWGGERQEREAEDRIVVGSAEDLSALHLGRCIVAVAEPLPKFPWMPKSWQAHFHLGQDQEKERFENSSAEVVLVSVHSTPSDSVYRYQAEQHWKKALLQNVLLPIDGAMRPYPPLHRVSISDIQRWHTDPEAFYQQRVLRIRENVISEQQAWGLAMHVLLDHFLRDFPPTAKFSVTELFDGLGTLADAFLPEMPWWKWSARRKLLHSIAECEYGHRQSGIRKSLTEQSGHLTFSFPQGTIALFGRADRIDYLDDGTAHIIDYKTGVTPSFVSLDRLESVQLPLEGWMVQSGAMGEPMVVSKLSWWSLHLIHGCRIKTYPRCVSALLDRYAIILPQWMNQLISGGYRECPIKIQS